MTISSSLNAGVSGLNANAGRLATISDNIANASTFGYKRAETDFAAMVVGEGGGIFSAGGVTSATRRTVDAKGALISTARSLDVAVNGSGMLPVAPVSSFSGGAQPEFRLMPTGSFDPDPSGLLRTTSGFALLGWPVGADGTVAQRPRDSAAGLEPVSVGAVQFSASPTTRMALGVNLPASATLAGAPGDPYVLPVEYFDNLGMSERLTARFTPTVPAAGASNTWTLTFEDSATDPALNPVAELTLTFDDATGSGGSLLSVTPVAGSTWDPATGAATITVARGDVDVTLGPNGFGSALSQLAADFAPVRVTKNGAAAGVLTGLEFDDAGMLQAIYDTGFRRPIWQVPVVAVPNANGLQVREGPSFSVTGASGSFYLWNSGEGPAGVLTGFAMEESTTDIAGELTALIRTQRAYSSNAKVIQTVDEMLQETSNIKR